MSGGLLQLIAERGRLRFDEYMDLALYHPVEGYYASGAQRTGFRGHYLTSPELTPAFAALWIRAFEGTWRACGEPSEFWVTEIGAGEGTFAAAITAFARGLSATSTGFGRALRYRIVEPVPALQKRQERAVPDASWAASLEALDPVSQGCVFANELLDNIPVRIVVGSEEGAKESWVELREGRPVEVLEPADAALVAFLRGIGVGPDPGHRFEVPEAAAAFVRTAAGSLERGGIYFVDYGDSTAGLSARPGGSLLCYSEAGVDDKPLERPGEKDITVHANWNVVLGELAGAGWRVAAPLKQRVFLEALGAREVAAAYRTAHDEAVREGRGADAVRALSGRSALVGLLDEGGLGGLDVVPAFKGIAERTSPGT